MPSPKSFNTCALSRANGNKLAKILASQPMNFKTLKPHPPTSPQDPQAIWARCCLTGSSGLLGTLVAAVAMPLWRHWCQPWIELVWAELHRNWRRALSPNSPAATHSNHNIIHHTSQFLKLLSNKWSWCCYRNRVCWRRGTAKIREHILLLNITSHLTT